MKDIYISYDFTYRSAVNKKGYTLQRYFGKGVGWDKYTEEQCQMNKTELKQIIKCSEILVEGLQCK